MFYVFGEQCLQDEPFCREIVVERLIADLGGGRYLPHTGFGVAALLDQAVGRGENVAPDLLLLAFPEALYSLTRSIFRVSRAAVHADV